MNFQATGLRMLSDVSVEISVELGRVKMPLAEVLSLGVDAVVPLERLTDELLDVLANGKPIAKAEIVTEGNRFAMRIVELLSEDSEAAGMADMPAAAAPNVTTTEPVREAAQTLPSDLPTQPASPSSAGSEG